MHKFAFCWGSAADPLGERYLPDGDLLTVFTVRIYQGDGGKGEGRRRGERKEK